MEIVGGIAATIQLADAAFRSLVKIYSVVQDAKELPQKLRDTLHDVENFRLLLQELQEEASRPGSKLAAAPVQSQRLANTLEATSTCSYTLAESIEKALPGPSNSKLKRAWRALVTLPKEDAILRECERLQKFKQDIQMELQIIGITVAHLTKYAEL